MKLNSGATFSRRCLALGFATILAFPASAEGKRRCGRGTLLEQRLDDEEILTLHQD
jgi:hypothetical protein